GGLVAFELAQRLRAQGERVHLFLVDTFTSRARFGLHREFVARIARLLKLDAGQELGLFLRLRLLAIGFDEVSGFDRVKFALRKASQLRRVSKWLRRIVRGTPRPGG